LYGMEESILTQTTIGPPSRPELELVEGFVKKRISIIVPAYNEANSIERGVADIDRQFEAVSEDYEIIIVDDGSEDGTAKIIRQFTDKKIKIVGYDRNQGKGHAIKRGLYHATGQYAFLIDSDSEIQAKNLMNYVDALGSADFVIGSKRHPLSTVRTPAGRRFLSLGFNVLERLLTGVHATDTQAGLKAARSTALYQVLPLLSVKRYAFDAELLAVASLFDFKIKELPVNIDLRATFSARQVFRMFIDLLGIAYRLRIKHWYQRNKASMSNTYNPIIPW
jgi:glycosyltransferase involved in cell wall biosynthesis